MIIKRNKLGSRWQRDNIALTVKRLRRYRDKAKSAAEAKFYDNWAERELEQSIKGLKRGDTMVLPVTSPHLAEVNFSTVENFKPKFRARFRRGDFTYVQAKNPRNEALNHQAYKEVAGEDEFKNNPETYKIRAGQF